MNMDYSNLTIDYQSTISHALKQMDNERVKLLIVINSNKYFSMLSIGDIQRSIINNISFDTQVNEILRDKSKITVCSSDDENDTIKQRMLEFRTEYMPIIDNSGEIQKVVFWKELFNNSFKRSSNSKINVPVVIMAGGQGTRLKPLTNVIPKALVPVGDKPILSQIFDRFIDYGCSDFHISVNYKAKMIEDYYGSKYNNHKLLFFQESNPLGTAGSLHLLKGKIKSTFFVTNCDILIDQDYKEVLDYHKSNKNDLTIVAALKHLHIPYGIIETSSFGKLESIKEKPDFNYLVNSGMYILEAHLLDEIPTDKVFHITELIKSLMESNRNLGVFPVSEKSWFDIGVWNEYQNTQEQFLKFILNK